MAEFTSAIFDKYVHKVYALCRKYTNDVSTAKDYMQECFLHIYENYSKYDESRGTLDGWIYRVSTNVVLKELQKNKKVLTDELSDNHMDYSDDIEPVDSISPEILMETLEQLPVGYKQVLTMYILQNKSHQEIARALNITESSSRSQLTRAKVFLKKLINKTEYGRV